MSKLKLLFLCTGNSCRSQMAEGWARELRSEEFDVWSAGIETHGLNPLAVAVMKEAGIDISQQVSSNLDEFDDVEFDIVVTVCDNAREACPLWPGSATVIHHSFDDPPALAKNSSSQEEALNHYRRVRDEIRTYILELDSK